VALLCFLLYVTYVQTGRTPLLVSSLLLMALTIVSDRLFVVYFSGPVLVSRGRASRQIRFLLSAGVVTVLSGLVYWWITPAAASYTAAIGIEPALESATTLSQDITLALARDPLFVVVVLLVPLGYVLIYLVARVVRATPGEKGSREARSSQPPGSPIRRRVISRLDSLASYVVASCLATLAFVLGCHLYVNGATLRYLAPWSTPPCWWCCSRWVCWPSGHHGAGVAVRSGQRGTTLRNLPACLRRRRLRGWRAAH